MLNVQTFLKMITLRTQVVSLHHPFIDGCFRENDSISVNYAHNQILNEEIAIALSFSEMFPSARLTIAVLVVQVLKRVCHSTLLHYEHRSTFLVVSYV